MHRIAARLGLRVCEVRTGLDAPEVRDWFLFFNQEEERRDKIDYYLAQIAGYLSGKDRFKISEFYQPNGSDNRGQTVLKADEAELLTKAMYG